MFYITPTTSVSVILWWVVGRVEETSTYSWCRILYCKLPSNGKQLPAFPLEVRPGLNSDLRGGRRVCYHCTSRFWTVNLQPVASSYRLTHLRLGRYLRDGTRGRYCGPTVAPPHCNKYNCNSFKLNPYKKLLQNNDWNKYQRKYRTLRGKPSADFAEFLQSI